MPREIEPSVQNSGENDPSRDAVFNRCRAEIFDGWKTQSVVAALADIYTSVFPQIFGGYQITSEDSPEEKIFKKQITDSRTKSIRNGLLQYVIDPGSSLVLVRDTKKRSRIVGYSLAVPIGMYKFRRISESNETAYVTATALMPDYQGHRLVEKIMPLLEQDLINKGYSYIERDVVTGKGYSRWIERYYGERIIEKQGPFISWVGEQIFYRILLK